MSVPEFPELAWLNPDCKRVGMVVPPSNPVAEPELDALVGDDIILYSERLPRFAGMTLEERNESYVPAYRESLDGLYGLGVECALIAMTGPNYRLGPAGDRELCHELSAEFNAPVYTASLAIHDALNALGIGRIKLVTPYPDWLTDQTVSYWSKAGVNIVSVNCMLAEGEEFRAYETTSDEVVRQLRAVEPEPGCAVLLTGTGMVSVTSIYQMSHAGRMPILSSNLCGAWWILQQCDRPGSGLYQQIAPHHVPDPA